MSLAPIAALCPAAAAEKIASKVAFEAAWVAFFAACAGSSTALIRPSAAATSSPSSVRGGLPIQADENGDPLRNGGRNGSQSQHSPCEVLACDPLVKRAAPLSVVLALHDSSNVVGLRQVPNVPAQSNMPLEFQPSRVLVKVAKQGGNRHCCMLLTSHQQPPMFTGTEPGGLKPLPKASAAGGPNLARPRARNPSNSMATTSWPAPAVRPCSQHPPNSRARGE